MTITQFVKSPRFFLYLGFGLIFLALICLPVKVKVVVQPEVMETEALYIGPIITLLIGLWSLPILLLGFTESFPSKKVVLPWFALILCFANIILLVSAWNAVTFWRDMLDRWLISYSPFLTPCIVTDIVSFLYFVKSEKFTESLENLKIRIFIGITFMAVPILAVGAVLYSWLM